jgi:hypothetical protein
MDGATLLNGGDKFRSMRWPAIACIKLLVSAGKMNGGFLNCIDWQ